jgi:hypothetical protein
LPSAKSVQPLSTSSPLAFRHHRAPISRSITCVTVPLPTPLFRPINHSMVPVCTPGFW